MSDTATATGTISLTIDGHDVSVPKGTTIFDTRRG